MMQDIVEDACCSKRNNNLTPSYYACLQFFGHFEFVVALQIDDDNDDGRFLVLY